jgi:hypothetical protein
VCELSTVLKDKSHVEASANEDEDENELQF